MPERIICLDGLPYQRGGDLGAIELKYILNFPIPMTVLYEEIPPEQSFGLVVEMHPDIKFRGVGLDRTRFECLHTLDQSKTAEVVRCC